MQNGNNEVGQGSGVRFRYRIHHCVRGHGAVNVLHADDRLLPLPLQHIILSAKRYRNEGSTNRIINVVFFKALGTSTSRTEEPVVSIEIFLIVQNLCAFTSMEHLLVMDPPILFPSMDTFYSSRNRSAPNRVIQARFESGLAIQAISVLQHIFP